MGLRQSPRFAFLAATLFVNGMVSAGTMVAVFIATSDEALPMLLANPSEYKSLLLLVVTKIIFAIIAGYVLDFILSLINKKPEVIETEDEDEDLELTISDPTCLCGNSMLENVVRRSLRILLFVFVITALFSFIIEGIGEAEITNFLKSTHFIQPFITSLIGFIPNCAVSIIMTELFLIDGLSFGALIAGLSVNAGIGTMVNKGYGVSTGLYLEVKDGQALFIRDNSPIEMSNRTERDLFDNLDIGDKVLVIHDGIAETYPGRTGVYVVFKLSDGTTGDIPQNVVQQLIDLGWLETEEVE